MIVVFIEAVLKVLMIKNLNKMVYPIVNKATRPVPHGPENIIRLPCQSQSESNYPQLITRGEFNNLTRDTDLSKDAVQLLGSN